MSETVSLGATVAFLAGVLSFLSPCVLPLVPSYLGLVTGFTLEEMTGRRRLAMLHSLLFVIGFFGIVLVAACNTTLQLTAPDALRGRVMSLHTLVFGGAFPIGAFVTGTVAEHWGVTTALVVNGTAGLAATGAVALWWRARGAGVVRLAP